MATEISALPSSSDYEQAVQILRQGGIVAYPTETFYGLAVDPENAEAVKDLYRLKKRSADKPLPLIVPDLAAVLRYTDALSGPCKILAEAFWPGPLTIVLKAAGDRLGAVMSRDKTIAVRISSHVVAARFCALFGMAVTASSANISGEQPMRTGEEVRERLGNRLAYVLGGGPTEGNMPSTIVRCEKQKCTVLRQGAVSMADIRDVLPDRYIVCKL